MSKQPTIDGEKQFVVNLLTTLRTERFSALAWWRFLVRSWDMSWETANHNPALKHSWWRVTLLMGVLTALVCLSTGFFEGFSFALRLTPGFVCFVGWQQSDLFWHLGLNRSTHTNALFSTVGVANVLTGVRGLGAAFLLGRLVGGLSTPIWLALVVFLVGVLTDILDGLVARYTKTQSKLGQIIDGEADFCLYLALSIILVQHTILPPWLGTLLVLRFFVPLIAALLSYFLFAHPVRFGSTLWGKGAGIAQCLYFMVLLAPKQFMETTHSVDTPLLIVTLLLTFVAPIAQILKNNSVFARV